MQKEQTGYVITFIGDNKEIPKEQHYKLISKDNDSIIIYAKNPNEAINLFNQHLLLFK